MKDITVYPSRGGERARLAQLVAQMEAAAETRRMRKMTIFLNIGTGLLWALMLAATWFCFLR
jgi:hypothetical protein